MNFEVPVRNALRWTALSAIVMIVVAGIGYILSNIVLLFIIFAISFAIFSFSSDTARLFNTAYRQILHNEYVQTILRKVHQITGANIVQELPNRGNRPR